MIPIVDLGAIGLGATDTKDEDLRSVGVSIRRAFQTVGFCYLSNHGIEAPYIEAYMKAAREFFNQPDTKKRDFEKTKEKLFGWVGCEWETLNLDRPADLKESFNFKPCEFPDEWTHDQVFRKLNFSMFEKSSKLALRICDALSLSLGLDKDFFRKAHTMVGSNGNETSLRTLYYPALSTDKVIKPGQIRCGEHTDYGTITLLYQDASGGLEVKVPEKGYVPAHPVPGTILINIGSLMQRWTADDLHATEHRVVIPEEEVTKRQCRQSMAFFVLPDNEAVVRCTDGSDKYKPVTCMEYLMSRIEPTY